MKTSFVKPTAPDPGSVETAFALLDQVEEGLGAAVVEDEAPPAEAEATVGRLVAGARHVARHQVARWFLAEDTTDAALLAMLLNQQYGQWRSARARARRALRQQLGAARGQRQHAQVADLGQALADLEAQEFTARVPTAYQLVHARRALAGNRRWAALAIVAGGGVLAWKDPVLSEGVGAALTTLGLSWAYAMGRRPWTWTRRTGALGFSPDDAVAHALERAAASDHRAAQASLEADVSAQEEVADALAVDLVSVRGALPLDDAEPYPIALATTAEQAEDCLRRALLAEGVDIASVRGARRFEWGWQVVAQVRSGSPEDLSATGTHRGLITRMQLPRGNGVMVEPWDELGDTCTVRLVQRNPFTTLGELPYRAPKSMSITEAADFGMAMDTSPLVFSLAGLMMLIVADSGAGKSGIMLALGEVATACRDAVVFNLDPYGAGVADLGEALTASALSDEDICETLQFLIDLAKARARMRQKYGMGNTWKPSGEHPAVVVLLDEWPKLSDRAKELLIALLLVGRKEAVWVFAGSQFGTSDYLGAPIGPKVAGRVLGACRGEDVTALLGAGALAEGYRADRLTPAVSPTDLRDAGVVFAKGLPGMRDRAIRYKFREVSVEAAQRLGAERAAAGLPSIAADCQEAGLDLDALLARLGAGGAGAPVLPAVLASIVTALDGSRHGDWVAAEDVVEQLRAQDPSAWARWDDLEETARRREQGKEVARRLRQVGAGALAVQRIVDPTDPGRKIAVYTREAVDEAVEEVTERAFAQAGTRRARQ